MNYFEGEGERSSAALTVEALNSMYEEAFQEGNQPNLWIMHPKSYKQIRKALKKRPAPRYCRKSVKAKHKKRGKK